MSIKRVFELNCNCKIMRNNIEVDIKGQKGKLRKLVLKVSETFPEQEVTMSQNFPPQNLKQPTLEQFFAKHPNPAQVQKSKIEPLKIDYLIYLYNGTEELFTMRLKYLININTNFIQEGKVTLGFQESPNSNQMLLISNSTKEMLMLFISHLNEAKKRLANFNKKTQTQSQVQQFQPSIELEESHDKKIPQLSQSQQLRNNRKLVANQPKRKDNDVKENLQLQKQTASTPLISSNKNLIMAQKSKARRQLPTEIILRILKFITQKDMYQLRIIDKTFEQVCNSSIEELSLKKYFEVPKEILFKLLTKFKNIRILRLGKLRNLKPTVFFEQTIANMPNLQTLDVGDYQQLNDKVAAMLISLCENITQLILPYNSKISNHTIATVKERCRSLGKFKLKSSSLDSNDLMNDQSVCALIAKRDLNFLSLPYITDAFFDQFNKISALQQTYESNIERLKIGQIIFGQTSRLQDDFEDFLRIHPRINKFSIKQIANRYTGLTQNLRYILLFNERSLLHINSVKNLSLGQIADDEFCKQISLQMPQLERFKSKSNQITDTGLEKIFEKCKQLKFIEISECPMVNGHCFESLPDYSLTLQFPLLQLKVQLDDYSLGCLEALLQSKAYEYRIKNVKKSQR